MRGSYYKASKLFNGFLKLTLGSYLKLLFNYRVDNGQIDGLKPPYIVLANHTNFWDPFLLSMCIPEPVYFLASDTYFRNPVLRQLLKLVGAIPKTKMVSDPASIKNIISVIKNNGIIGIYPEGRRNWDGTTLPLLYPTAKLIKRLNLPVVSVLSRGAYLSMPRWAKKTRKGGLTMTCSMILEAGEAAGLSADDIHEKISASLSYNEYDYQRNRMIPYYGRLLAERLELFLFICPDCKLQGTMKSSGDVFCCSSCKYTVRYDKYGFLTAPSGVLYFDNPRDWNRWQLDYLETRISDAVKNHAASPVIEDRNVTAVKGGRLEPLADIPEGSLALLDGGIIFTNRQSKVFMFDIMKIYGENIQYNDLLEFYHEKTLYRFGGIQAGISAYKWVKAIEIYKNIVNTGGW